MSDSVHANRPARLYLFAAALICGIVAAGCGGGSPGLTVATVGRETTAPPSTASSDHAPAGGPPDALAFAKCMRANGAPDFPDPLPGGGFAFDPGAGSISSPAFKAAQAKCQNLMPRPGAGPAFSEQALVQLRKITVCMRQHGIPQFPDPKRATTASLPLTPGPGDRMITDYRGVILEFPAEIDPQSPAYVQAAAACGASFLGRPH